MKDDPKKAGNRFWIIVILLILLVLFAVLLYNRSKNIESFKEEVHDIFKDSKLKKIDSCISMLYLAENNIRFYLITKDSLYLQQSYQNLSTVRKITSQLDQILHSSNTDEKLEKLINQKIASNHCLLNLSLYTDSLLQLSENLELKNIVNTKKNLTAPKPIQYIHLKPTITIDTIVEEKKSKAIILEKPLQKKNLLKRVANAIINKTDTTKVLQESTKKNQYIIHKKIELDTAAEIKKFNKKQINHINHYYLNYINVKKKLDKEEAKTLQLNSQIFKQLTTALTDLKEVFETQRHQNTNQFKNNLKWSVGQYELNATGLITIITLLAFIVVINLRKLYRDEKELMEYSKQVYEYANHNKEFLANMSHELRTPLNSIIGFSEQLAKNKLDTQSSEYVQAIHTSSTMLLGIVNDILDFSRLELDKVTLVDQSFLLQKLIIELIATLEIQAHKKSLKLETNLGNITPQTCLRGDAFRIKQIILNLLSNAIKYTQKGTVKLNAHIEEIDTKQIWLHIHITDTGIGIDEKYLDLIFDKFAQISSSEYREWQTGTGLGLAITKRIILLFGGKIHVESKINQGSKFSFSIPLKTAQIETYETEITTKTTFTKQDFENIKILLVDDNLMNIKLASILLQKWFVQFDVAYNGRQALQLFQQNTYNLVLTDVQMPLMNGVELTKAIRKLPNPQKSQTPIIGITANVLKNDILAYKNSGMDDILLKPYSEEEYLSKIVTTYHKI